MCPTIIPNASSTTYTLTEGDVGHAVEFGEIAYTSSGQASQPAFSPGSGEVLAYPPIHFTLRSSLGKPQFAYYIVEPAGHRPPTAGDWQHRAQGPTPTPGHVDVDAKPGETVYFSPTLQVGTSWGSVPQTLEPAGVSGKAYRVTGHTGNRARVVMPASAPAYHPALSHGELYVLGQLNRKRRAHGHAALKVSTILDEVASVGARDEATHGDRFPDPYFFTLAGSFGWPGDLTETAVTLIDAPLTQPAQVLAHWDGAYSGESTGLWEEIDQPYQVYVGIADGGGAWNIVLVSGCPAQVDPVRLCGLTNITGL
jgi:hypothetical protein